MDTIRGVVRNAGQTLARLLDIPVTVPERDPRLFWMVLYLAGALGWIAFFLAGDRSGEFYHSADWPKEYQYYRVIQQALQGGGLPWHTSIPLQPSQPTDRFLAIPETVSMLAPQVLLLRWVSIKSFVVLNFLLMYTVGTIGWHQLSRYCRFPPLVAAVGFVLFAFNGHVVSHTAAGHVMWSSYYWFSWFILLLLRACERPMAPRDAVFLALVLGGIVLQGGCHLYIWCLMFMGLFFVVHPWRHRMMILAVALGGLLAAYRFIPALLAFHSDKVHRLTGFMSWHAFMGTLTSGSSDGRTLFPWEFDYDISRAGVWCAFLLLALTPLVPACRQRLRCYWPLLVPTLALIVLSFNRDLYVVLKYLPIPGLAAERVPSRLLVLPFVFALTMACVCAANLLTVSRCDMRRTGAVLGLLVGGSAFWKVALHADAWRMAAMEMTPEMRLVAGWDPLPTIVIRPDPIYVAVVWGSLALSILTVSGIVGWLLWKRPSVAQGETSMT